MNRFGQRFIIAYDGLEAPRDILEFCRRFGIGGVILFSDNYQNPLQLTEAVAEIKQTFADGPAPFISCDHEGGRVQRFRQGFTRLPPMAELGRRDPAETYRQLSQAARELNRCGINLNFAPVADLCPADRPGAIGDRAFGSDPAHVAGHVAAAITAYQDNGVLACVKHFPGHGATQIDSHNALPEIHRDAEQAAADLAPFEAAIRADVGAVMTAHVLAPAEGAGLEPASLSPYWIDRVLRRRMGFGGLIISDAMEMAAIRDRWPPLDAGFLALDAGTDIVLFYIIEEQLRAVHDLCVAQATGRFNQAANARSLSRIARAKARIAR